MAYPLKWSCRAQKECQRCCCTTPNEVFLPIELAFRLSCNLLLLLRWTCLIEWRLLASSVSLSMYSRQQGQYYYYYPVPGCCCWLTTLTGTDLRRRPPDADEGNLIGHRSIAISSPVRPERDSQCHCSVRSLLVLLRKKKPYFLQRVKNRIWSQSGVRKAFFCVPV